MKPVLEQKLRELIEESNRQVAPAMSTVLRLLLSAHLNGKQNDFAKHCCKFSPVGVDLKIKARDEMDEGWPESGSTKFVH